MSKTDFQNGFALGRASGGVVEVVDTTEIDALEELIDESGALEDTEGTVTEKVEELIDKAEELDVFMYITNNDGLFANAKTFPNKAVVNLPNAVDLYQAFSHWNTEPIPIVEELTVNAPKVTVLSNTFYANNGVEKVILNVSNETQRIELLFAYCKALEEVVLNFSTKKVTFFSGIFGESTIKRIIGVLDFSSASIITGFGTCGYLEEITVEPNTIYVSFSLGRSNKLTSESVQSIIEGLATVETAQTLTLNSAITLTDEQKATINAKGWTLAQ